MISSTRNGNDVERKEKIGNNTVFLEDTVRTCPSKLQDIVRFARAAVYVHVENGEKPRM